MKKISLLFICVICICSCKCRQLKLASTLNAEDKKTTVSQSHPQIKDIIDQGELTIDKYKVSYILARNEIIAHVISDTITIEPGASREIRNKSLFLTVSYEDRVILDNIEIRSTSFKEIEGAEKFSLGPQDDVHDDWFSVVNDVLVVEFGVSVEDTDWGYLINLHIDRNGQISSNVTNFDDLMVE